MSRDFFACVTACSYIRTETTEFPKLWAATGVDYPQLIERLIRLGIERHQEKKNNQYSR